MSTRRLLKVDARGTLACGLLITLMLAFSPAPATAEEKSQIKVTGTFSNMMYNNMGGDVLGIEMFLVYSNKGYFVVYQSSEGEPSVPVVVPAKISGSDVSFIVPPTIDSRGTFHGTIGNQELSGTFSGNQQTVHLKRKASYWQ